MSNNYDRCFPVNFVKFLRVFISVEHLWWLHLNGTPATYATTTNTTTNSFTTTATTVSYCVSHSLVYQLQGSKLELHLIILYIRQNFKYGFRVKPNDKYLYIWKCNSITNNSKNEIPGNKDLFKLTSTQNKRNKVWLIFALQGILN